MEDEEERPELVELGSGKLKTKDGSLPKERWDLIEWGSPLLLAGPLQTQAVPPHFA